MTVEYMTVFNMTNKFFCLECLETTLITILTDCFNCANYRCLVNWGYFYVCGSLFFVSLKSYPYPMIGMEPSLGLGLSWSMASCFRKSIIGFLEKQPKQLYLIFPVNEFFFVLRFYLHAGEVFEVAADVAFSNSRLVLGIQSSEAVGF